MRLMKRIAVPIISSMRIDSVFNSQPWRAVFTDCAVLGTILSMDLHKVSEKSVTTSASACNISNYECVDLMRMVPWHGISHASWAS